MRKTSEIENTIISKMTIESDVAFVSENYATLDRTISDQRLIEDYRNDLSPEEENSPDPQRVQACNRLKLGLGDPQDNTKCPDIKTALLPRVCRRLPKGPLEGACDTRAFGTSTGV